MTTRRAFIERAALSAAGLALPGADRLLGVGSAGAPAPQRDFLDIRRPPDAVMAQTASEYLRLAPGPAGRWEGGGVTVTTAEQAGRLHVALAAPAAELRRLQLRWRGRLGDVRLVLGDAWERGYGDLEWRGLDPDRVMPWYCAATDGALTHAYGVGTSAKALCFWQLDPDGLSLWADVRSGGAPLRLGERALDVCDVVCRAGQAGETAFAALRAFCAAMSPSPRLPARPVYGHNDWYWAYGKSSAESVRGDVARIVELSPTGSNRPFAVIDDGWQPGRGADASGAGAWDRGNDRFGDMAALAAGMRGAGARPGIWIRPLLAAADTPDAWRLSRERGSLDPTVPEVARKVGEDVARLARWGFELIKHDYTTYDVFGRWGFQMGSALTPEGWSFAAGRGRTTAEVLDDLYRTIREAAGETLVLGCNTVGHLSAGRFELCRVGDDTSGTEWARTRKMGVNSLAFRAVQHGAFYAADPDCAAVTAAVPWSLGRQWLDLVARSGTMLFVSIAPDALGTAQRADLKAALALAAEPRGVAEPVDWQRTVCPTRWRLMGEERTYDWSADDGTPP